LGHRCGIATYSHRFADALQHNGHQVKLFVDKLRFFNPDIRKNVQVNTGSMLSKYLDSDKKWALAPMSVITILKQYSDISYYHLETTPPPRYCYMLINRNLSKEKHLLIDNFIQQIEEYIETQTDICVFEPWMDQFSIQPNKKADT